MEPIKGVATKPDEPPMAIEPRMKLIFIDETGDRKYKDYLGVCVATMDSKSYPLLKREALKILESANWDPDLEFKGSYLFSASKGATEVDVEARVDVASRLLDLNASENSRLRFAYTDLVSKDKGAGYLAAVGQLLSSRKVIGKAPTGAGKNLVAVVCDELPDVGPRELHEIVRTSLEPKGYILLERVMQAASGPESIGLMYADLVAYLMGRIETISNDAEFFEGLDQEQLSASGKIKKLQSSTGLIEKIKSLEVISQKSPDADAVPRPDYRRATTR